MKSTGDIFLGHQSHVNYLNPISIDLFVALWYLGDNVPTDIETPVKPQAFVQIKSNKNRKIE